MPPSVPYTPRPFVGDRFESRDRTSDAIRQSARDESDAMRRQGQRSAQMWSGIGANISGTLQDIAAYPEQQRARALLAAKAARELRADQQAQAAEKQAQAMEQTYRQLQGQYQGRIPNDVLAQVFPSDMAAHLAKQQNDLFGDPDKMAEKAAGRGRDVVADMGGYGPLDESQVDDVMQSPAGNRTRYGFGPGTANGPEVLPNAIQQQKIDADQSAAERLKAVERFAQQQGGVVNAPGTGVVLPPKPEAPPRPVSVPDGGRIVDPVSGKVIYSAPPKADTESRPTTASLAVLAANGDEKARKALEIIQRSEGGRSPQALQNFMTLSGQYQKSPLVAASDRTVILADSIKAIRNDPSLPAAQMALAYSFIQVLDTYQSAVREGELQNLSGLATQMDQLRVSANRVYNTGAFMPEKTAKEIADTSARLIQAIESARAAKEKDFAARARVAGVGDMWNDYRGATSGTVDAAAPDLSGVRPGMGRRFTEGPFKGQTWSVGADGKPFKVGG